MLFDRGRSDMDTKITTVRLDMVASNGITYGWGSVERRHGYY
jgi:hypothetical protein